MESTFSTFQQIESSIFDYKISAQDSPVKLMRDKLKKKIKEIEQANIWGLDDEVEKKLAAARRSQKIAFLSGCPRTYYPDPGHSKFGLIHANFGDKDLPPYKMYKPQDGAILGKHVSTKGYGIGGLSAPRFKKIVQEDTPGPTYLPEEQQHSFPPSVWMHYGIVKRNQMNPRDLDERAARKLNTLWGKCHQIKVAFGRNTKQDRFEKDPPWNNVGPGHYHVRKHKGPKASVTNSFLNGPVCFSGTTKLHCSYGPKEFCAECGLQLMHSADYYRSRYRLHLEPLVILDKEDMEEHVAQNAHMASKSELVLAHIRKLNMQQVQKHTGKRKILLCRSCYCKAIRGTSNFWKKPGELQEIFEKTRYCGYMHEHNGFPEFIHKSSDYWTRRLNRKEVMLNKYWGDKCSKRLLDSNGNSNR